MKKLRCLLALAFAASGLAVLVPSAGATGSAQGPPAGPTTPPFFQCPAIGLDTTCQFLVDVTDSGINVVQDSSQGYYDGSDDVTVAIQNDSSGPLGSVHLGVANSGDDAFGFDGDGLCNPGSGPSPDECPFGPPGNLNDPFDYFGPDTVLEVDPASTDDGTVAFTTPLQPGQFTYISLEAPPFGTPYLAAGNVNDVVTTELTDTESIEILPGAVIAVPAQAAITDKATIQGPNALEATGTVKYKVYSDPNCTKLATEQGGEKKVENGAAEASDPVGKGLADNARYYWVVEYSGNKGEHENTPAISACGNEVMTFGTPPALPKPTIATVLSGGGQIGAQITVPSGTAVTDNATLTAPEGQPVSGRLSYEVYTDPQCSPFSQLKGAGGGLTTGTGPASTPLTLAAGTYYFQASYSGNGTLGSAVSPCGSEVLTVAPPPPPPPPPNSGFTIHSITSSSNGTVTITFVPTQSGVGTLVVTVPTASIASTSAVAAKAKKCKKGQIKIKRRCRPSTTVAGKASAKGTAGVPLTLTVNLSSKIKARLKKGKTIHLTATLTYQSSLGGTATVVAFPVTVKGKRPHHHKKR